MAEAKRYLEKAKDLFLATDFYRGACEVAIASNKLRQVCRE